MIASQTYRVSANHYKKRCGATIGKKDPFGFFYWQDKGWLHDQDPYGWFHWYTRFFQGRRSDDDRRQIDRWVKIAGPKGRWKQNLIG